MTKPTGLITTPKTDTLNYWIFWTPSLSSHAPWVNRLCRIKLSLRLNLLPHTEHTKTDPPACNLKCRLSVPAWAKHFPHTRHWKPPSLNEPPPATLHSSVPSSPDAWVSYCWNAPTTSDLQFKSASGSKTSYSTVISCEAGNFDNSPTSVVKRL